MDHNKLALVYLVLSLVVAVFVAGLVAVCCAVFAWLGFVASAQTVAELIALAAAAGFCGTFLVLALSWAAGENMEGNYGTK
jgi:hypothetical protein